MSKKLKMTGFARFFFVMIILAPLAYIGASYYNNEDGIENFKNLFKGKISTGEQVNTQATTEEATKTVEIPASSSEVNTDSSVSASELAKKEERIKNLVENNRALKNQLEEKTKELEEVKEQLDKIKSAIGQE